MKLHIENICKISSADIDLNGITIITGDNNTGKSTVGKILWTMFVALADLKGKAVNERINGCRRILHQYAFGYSRNKDVFYELSRKLVNGEISIADVLDSLNKSRVESRETALAESDLTLIRKALNERLSFDDAKLQRQIVLDSFNWMFARQFAPIGKNNVIPLVKMIIKGAELSVSFENAFPTVKIELELHNSPYLFDSLNQLDDTLENNSFARYVQNKKIKKGFQRHEDTGNAALDNVLLKQKFDEIDARISNTIGGRLIYDANKGFQFAASALPEPLNLENLSQGIKSMAILQAAFSSGAIKEGDVLILDEPEIHLHPDWQIKYAEFIVLLQKAFNLTVLLTTHSPDFVQAIRLYSECHGLEGSLNAYIAETTADESVTMRAISQDNMDEVLERFATSFDTLMNLRRALEDKRNG